MTEVEGDSSSWDLKQMAATEAIASERESFIGGLSKESKGFGLNLSEDKIQ